MQGHTPEDSTVETFKTKGYAVFRNVLLRETGLLFFLPERLADAPPDVTHQVPNVTEMLRWQFWSDSTNMQVGLRPSAAAHKPGKMHILKMI